MEAWFSLPFFSPPCSISEEFAAHGIQARSGLPDVCVWCRVAGAGDVSTTALLLAECGHAVGGQICLAFTMICEFPASNQLVKLKPFLLCAEEQT